MSAACKAFAIAAEQLAFEVMRNIQQGDPARFDAASKTMAAGGFITLQTSYGGGRLLDTSLLLYEPFGGSTEIWNSSSDHTENTTASPQVNQAQTKGNNA